MQTPRPTAPRPPNRLTVHLRTLLLLCFVALAAGGVRAQRTTIHTRALQTVGAGDAVDAGPLSVSEPLTLTVRLRPTAAQSSALDHLLAAQTDSTSASYHQWLTPEQFAAEFGASDEQLAMVKSYFEANGMTVSSVSAGRTRLTVRGISGQAQLAFETSLHRVRVNAADYFANATDPSLPAKVASVIAGISGLDDLPQQASARIAIGSAAPNAVPRTSLAPSSTAGVEGADSLVAVADAIDANTTAVLSLASSACGSEIADADVEAYRSLFRQASAQGITVLAAGSCQGAAAADFPGSLAEVTALAISPRDVASATPGIDARPSWQAAPGLPADGLRHEPDVTTSSAAAFAQTIATLNAETGNRVGNVGATLYALAKIPGLFTQPDATREGAGNWEPASGLGVVDLKMLLKVYPRGLSSTVTYLQSTSYAINYGDSFTLKAQVVPSVYGTTNPTGTVTFTSSTQGTLGSTTIDNGGNASLTPNVLPVGVYSVTAVYSGDGSYGGSASTSKVTITVSLVNANLAATISPAINIPYGANATVTATVTLPGANASPSGPVSAQISSGPVNSATLSPNPGSNSATANIAVTVPPPGKYNVQVTCQGTSNFQCQTPVNLPINTVKGYTSTTISVVPAAPQAGEPISLTATVLNTGNGTATYTYSGSISFFDSGKLIATAPVGTNQATTTTALSGTRTHNITAVYSGDANWNTSTSDAVAVLPTILPDELTLSTNVNGSSSLAGVNIIFTASISTTVVYATGPTGTVTFFDTFNNTVVQLGNPSALVSNGPYASIGLFTTTGLQPGVHRIYAQYSGDDSYAATISPVLTLSMSDFNVTMTPSTLVLSQGKSADVTALIGASGGFSGTVSLGCTPPGSSEATCNISPSSVGIGQTATITITTTAARALSPGQKTSRLRGWSCAAGASLATLFFFLSPRRRRLPVLLALLCAACLSANLGCAVGSTTTTDSGGGGSDPADPGTPLGTQNYSITAAGSDGVNTVRHTYQFQVTVQ